VQPSALDRQAQIGALDHLAAHDNTRAQSSGEIEDQAPDLDDEELIEAEFAQDQADEAENDDHDSDGQHTDDEDTDDEDNEVDDDPVDTQENHKTPQTPVNSNTSSDPSVPSASRSALPPTSAIQHPPSDILLTSAIPPQILTLPAEVPSFSPKKPDPAPGFPFCLAPKPSGTAPSFEEMARFMPPPSKSFNPFWPESDILYLCYPGRTDKHNLRSAIVSHQEMLARSGAQALVDRNHFSPDQQSHQAYVAAEDFYKQLARKTPPPDH